MYPRLMFRRSLFCAGVLLAVSTPARADTTTRVSVGPGGVQANGTSSGSVVSADGRFVVFLSLASNLVAGDTNGRLDIFTYDRQQRRTALLVAGLGSGSTPPSAVSVSSTGRFVAFDTSASLVAADRGGNDIYVRDRKLGKTIWASVGLGGAQPNSPSIGYASISGNGRYVVFKSSASNLVAGLSTRSAQLYVRDLQSNRTACVTLRPDGAPSSSGAFESDTAISADGRFVAFKGTANDLVPGDTNNENDVFVRDMVNRVTVRASLGNGGVQADRGIWNGSPISISSNGRFVAFASGSTNLVAADSDFNPDIFVRDLQLGVTLLANVRADGSSSPNATTRSAISANGRFVAFDTVDKMTPDDPNSNADVFVRDLQLRTTKRISYVNAGADVHSAATVRSISGDGSVVSFESAGDNFVPGDTNRAQDVFVRSP